MPLFFMHSGLIKLSMSSNCEIIFVNEEKLLKIFLIFQTDDFFFLYHNSLHHQENQLSSLKQVFILFLC